MRQTVLGAALLELQRVGFEEFSLAAVAKQCSVSEFAIRQIWPNRLALVSAAVAHGATTPTIPDTGALRTDLTQWAAALAAHLNSEDGRKTLRSMSTTNTDYDPLQSKSSFFSGRIGAASTMVERAARRGELREGVDPLAATAIIAHHLTGLVLLYEDRVITEADYTGVVEVVLGGILKE